MSLGSIRVRSDRRLAADFQPEYQHAEDDAISEPNYFDELQSPNLVLLHSDKLKNYESDHEEEPCAFAIPEFQSATG